MPLWIRKKKNLDEEVFFSLEARGWKGGKEEDLFFFVIIRRLQEQLHSWWFYSFQRLRFYRLFLFPFINFRSRYTREFPSMNLLTTRPGVEPRLIIHAWSCISQPSERGKTALCESPLLFFFLLYYYFIEFPFRNKYHKFFIYLFLRSLGWKESDVHHARLIWIFECNVIFRDGPRGERKKERIDQPIFQRFREPSIAFLLDEFLRERQQSDRYNSFEGTSREDKYYIKRRRFEWTFDWMAFAKRSEDSVCAKISARNYGTLCWTIHK